MQNIHYFGIRHHGPGSAKRLLAALDELQPRMVLVEGPADCNDLFPVLADKDMKPPVALLAYASDQPGCSLYYPFAEYSPEYQACRWAVESGAGLAFIDLPVSQQLAQMLEKQKPEEDLSSENDEEAIASGQAPDGEADREEIPDPISTDPIGTLAKIAGYEDGEAWWNDLIEQNCDTDREIFMTVETAMQELRNNVQTTSPLRESDLPREAHMRLEIEQAAKNREGPVAVVCGAWHVPALKEKHTAKADRDALGALPPKLAKSKVKATWVPWTSPRLAERSGYGAGVDAPMWYQHLWEKREHPDALEQWLCKVAHILRESGSVVSTASIIESVRLCNSLAAVRNRPSPGFEECRDAIIACLCFGEPLVWQQMEERILLGNLVGEIPPNAPLAPLLEDLQRLQKRNKLKPEALERELSIDLRSDTGLGRSILLHRLNILGVPWGKLSDAGRSRGTFRECWTLSWQPEYAVRLVEALVYGNTIEQAAGNKIIEAIPKEKQLGQLAGTVQLCLDSHLNKAADVGLQRLQERAAHADDCLELLESLPPLIHIHRYGTARAISLEHIGNLAARLAVQAAVSLPYACRNLNEEESRHYRKSLLNAHDAVQLAELDGSTMQDWWQALENIVETRQSCMLVTGLCARLLYKSDKMDANPLQDLMQRMLSPALPVADAALFFDGFFSEAVQSLLYDEMLLQVVETWLISLSDDSFTEYLPLFRRVFSELDAMERKRMIDTILQGRSRNSIARKVNEEMVPLWTEQLQRLGRLIGGDKQWHQ
jgi:hypothetical protein